MSDSVFQGVKTYRLKNNTIHSNGTKKEAPLLIIQGTEFNYRENIKRFPKLEEGGFFFKKKNTQKPRGCIPKANGATTLPSTGRIKNCFTLKRVEMKTVPHLDQSVPRTRVSPPPKHYCFKQKNTKRNKSQSAIFLPAVYVSLILWYHPTYKNLARERKP